MVDEFPTLRTAIPLRDVEGWLSADLVGDEVGGGGLAHVMSARLAFQKLADQALAVVYFVVPFCIHAGEFGIGYGPRDAGAN